MRNIKVRLSMIKENNKETIGKRTQCDEYSITSANNDRRGEGGSVIINLWTNMQTHLWGEKEREEGRVAGRGGGGDRRRRQEEDLCQAWQLFTPLPPLKDSLTQLAAPATTAPH